LSKEEKEDLVKRWKTGKFTTKELGIYFRITSLAILGLLKRRGFTVKRHSFPKGHTPWNKGIEGLIIPWNKGLTKDLDSRVMAHSIRMKNDNPSKRLDIRKKMSVAQTGEKSHRWKGGISKDQKYLNWLKNKRNRLKRRAEGEHSNAEWEELKRKNNYCCVGCKRREPEIKLTEDHIFPLSRGGDNSLKNIQPLCKSCNSKKHTKINYQF
jgi:5-methylcytosine-specific restriction endonuclease McrA